MVSFIRLKKEKDKVKKDFQTDGEGHALFDVSIKDKTQVLAPFYVDNKQIVSTDFAEMLDNAVQTVPAKEKIHVSLKCENLSEEEKKNFAGAIKNYYANKMKDAQIRLKRTWMLIIATIILSATALGGLVLANLLNAPWVVCEIVDIVTWVFVWETVDLIAFQRTLIKIEYYRAKSLYESKVTY